MKQTNSENTLLLHNPDSSPTNIIGSHSTAEDALKAFVEDQRCPKAIRDDYLNSLIKNQEDPVSDINVEDLVPSQVSFDASYEQEDWMQGLGEVIVPSNIDDDEPIVDDNSEIGDDELDQTDVGYDWCQDAKDIGITSVEIKDVEDWIKVQKLKANIDLSTEEKIDIFTLNEQQKKVFNVLKTVVDENKAQKLLDMSGGAGTGKSYVINAISQYAHEATGNRNFVRVAAPTGNAASLFSGGETLHSMFKIPAEKWFSESLDDLMIF